MNASYILRRFNARQNELAALRAESRKLEAARRAEKAWQDSLALFEAGIEIGRKLEAAQRAEKEGKA